MRKTKDETMPELRKDPVVGRWVIIATERARRPGNIVDTGDGPYDEKEKECLFCKSQQQALYTTNDLTVIAYQNSFLKTDNEFKRTSCGLYEVSNAFGAHEVIIESKEHISNMADLDTDHIKDVFATYADRMKELESNKDLKYVLAYKNYGETAGSRSFAHARSHIIATPVLPIRAKEKFWGTKEYYDENGSCIYCDLIKQELKNQKRIVMETEHFLVVAPFAARFMFELLILPKKHHCNYVDGIEGFEEELARIIKTLLQKYKIGVNDPAYNYMIQTAPFYKNAQDDWKWKNVEHDFHWHIELMPRLTRIAGFEKGTGFYICSIPPELSAEYLRGVNINGTV